MMMGDVNLQGEYTLLHVDNLLIVITWLTYGQAEYDILYAG